MFEKPSMRLTEPVELPEQYRDVVVQFLADWWHDRLFELQNGWGFQQIGPLERSDLLRTPLAERLAVVARYAVGEDAPRDYVLDHIQAVLEALFSLGTFYEIPINFWATPIGWMLLTAQIRAEGDRLLTITDAAELLHTDVKRVSEMVRRGRLTGYRDPSEKNPRKATRVRKSAVQALMN